MYPVLCTYFPEDNLYKPFIDFLLLFSELSPVYLYLKNLVCTFYHISYSSKEKCRRNLVFTLTLLISLHLWVVRANWTLSHLLRAQWWIWHPKGSLWLTRSLKQWSPPTEHCFAKEWTPGYVALHTHLVLKKPYYPLQLGNN